MCRRFLCFLAFVFALSLLWSPGAEGANDASIMVYFSHVGEDCPAGGRVWALEVGHSLIQPPDTTNPGEECPEVPTSQDIINQTWWESATKSFVPPDDPGRADSLLISGLPYDAPVWVGARATDESGNVAALIVKRINTGAAPDTIPPKPVDFRFFR